MFTELKFLLSTDQIWIYYHFFAQVTEPTKFGVVNLNEAISFLLMKKNQGQVRIKGCKIRLQYGLCRRKTDLSCNTWSEIKLLLTPTKSYSNCNPIQNSTSKTYRIGEYALAHKIFYLVNHYN